MFTGLVEELGEVAWLNPSGDAAQLAIRARVVVDGLGHGDSIAVNGVCLTVVEQPEPGMFVVDAMGETLRHTSVGALAPGSLVHLERALALGDRLGGHLVQGHVDGTGRVLSHTKGEQWDVVRISLPEELRKYVAHKGSITVDGVSLTVSAIGGPEQDGSADNEGITWFEVSLIPETIRATTLGRHATGDVVNLEVDVIAKYVERLTLGVGR
ncbi:riboflavin synthase, alpha subunit [Segniliparus rotundus DSM 44985]|uniref:Riboflavin synthase n=1 Tax=Segniliparus rotundus (strain ATCC BAA-972 / CDC 1076 / CIP 108378 / DSM 44985 / JCM 13578) TaxID=640132 RepID=D6ZCB6_SEGRD|nr:riboflavin synthase [Segniliparus rotundus]ADG99085.1 riboflavin synthase, alpha subunit [Segniliparus rotundus DSM 44985]